jgi:1,5-anhydro-D-fructose reductase (1,5-anhydro-D-mannitol-forming)
MSRLRWGLVGASDIAATRMIPAMRRLGHEAVAVMSASSERAAAYAEANAIGRVFTELEEFLGQENLDAVYISTTNELHCVQTVAAAAAGKHVLCEKPLALSLDDAWTMVRACALSSVVFATNHHLPAAGTHQAVGQLIANGAIGEPLAMRLFHAVRLPDRLQGWRLDAPSRGGGVIFDITCHDAAAVRAILGREALEAAAISVRQGPWRSAVEDAVVTALRFEGNVLVQTHDAFTVGYADTGFEVHGSDGSIIARNTMTQDPVGSVVLHDRSGEREIRIADRRDLYEVTLEAFAEAIDGKGRPIVDGADGARALAVALAVKEAAATGRTAVVVSEPTPATAAV